MPKLQLASNEFLYYFAKELVKRLVFKKKRDQLIARKVYKCKRCNYWCIGQYSFHFHVLKHQKLPPYSCSGCNFASLYPWKITEHIEQLKAEICALHKDARIVTCKNIPARKYAEYYETARVPAGTCSGWFGGRSSHSNEALRSPSAELDTSMSREFYGNLNPTRDSGKLSCAATDEIIKDLCG